VLSLLPCPFLSTLFSISLLARDNVRKNPNYCHESNCGRSALDVTELTELALWM
jgi:hypothetical protein